jgi:hypothetical protein
MVRTIGLFALGAAIGGIALLSVTAQEKTEKHEIKGGIEGKVKRVDADGNKLTITTTQGRERTFTVDDDTMMVGPRGGKVRKHLKDPRFHEGFPLTVVAEGNTATEVHLGFAHEADTDSHAKSESRDSGTKTKTAETQNPPKKASTGTGDAAKTSSRAKEAKKLEEEDDEEELPGVIKSYDHDKRVLVVTLLNGKTRSFLLAKSVPVNVHGTVSKRGLEDPELKVGAAITVVTDEGGKKVKELKVVQRRVRKAG